MSAVFAFPDNAATAAYRKTIQEQWRAIGDLVASQNSPQLTLSCRLLSALLDGSCELPDLSLVSAVPLMRPFSYYLADSAEIQEIVATLAVLTAHGRLTPQLTQPEIESAETAVPFWTFYYIKERDLDNVCPLLRTLQYLHLEDLPEYDEAVHYVLRQAREDGSFATADLSCNFLSYLQPESVERGEDDKFSAYRRGCVDLA